MDERMDQPGTDALELTVLFVGTSFRVNPTTGNAKYKMTLAYPAGYDEYLKHIAANGVADLFWGDGSGEWHPIALSAAIISLSMKPQKDADPLYTVNFDIDPGDATRFNINGYAARNAAGQLRIESSQLALFTAGTKR